MVSDIELPLIFCHSEKAERDLNLAMLEIKSGQGSHAAEMAEAVDQNSSLNEQRAKYAMWLFDEVRESPNPSICVPYQMHAVCKKLALRHSFSSTPMYSLPTYIIQRYLSLTEQYY